MDYEKLGAFYLGRRYDPNTEEISAEALLYDSKDLTTHAVCVGMTGSGKTGLCVSLLEEAAIDGVPAIAIDPKGDLANLLLTFPDLAPSDFRPWVDEREAERKNLSLDDYAADVAGQWRSGLAQWGQGPERIRRLRDACEFALYTPASSAGRNISALRSFSAPSPEVLADGEAFREKVASTASSLLALLGVNADPIQSREHVLVSSLLDHAWRSGRDLDVAQLIIEIQSPALEKIGIMDLEDFFPKSERSKLAMTLNSLLASPGFSAWMEGEALDIKKLLWSPQGKPKISIVSIAHLSDSERMFFVTLLLSEVVNWMRTQSGTSSLRAILYMDEVFGFFPPTEKPPSKQPMLTLMKQARAYGLGVVLATQNPVDLDYKGLSNAGTWFLGRLQTERDVLRVVEGLQSASSDAGSGLDVHDVSKLLAELKSRVFLMNNVHEDAPALFHTRWALSYLRGPLTRDQLKTLSTTGLVQPAEPESVPIPSASTGSTVNADQKQGARGQSSSSETRPSVDAEIQQKFAVPSGSTEASYRPVVMGTADLHYASSPMNVDIWTKVTCIADVSSIDESNIWTQAEVLEEVPPLADQPKPGAHFADIAQRATKAKSYPGWEKSLKSHLYKECPLVLWTCPELKLASQPGESQADFRVRVRDAARECRDQAVEKLRDKYATQTKQLQDQILRAEHALAQQEEEYSEAKVGTALSAGSAVLGALFGRKLASLSNVGKATSTMRSASKIASQKQDVARAQEKLAELKQRLASLEADVEADLAKTQKANDPDLLELIEKVIRPRKTDTEISRLFLVWMPTARAPMSCAAPEL